VNSKPEEKRALIEEAAGVLKYRMRRQESERKLDRTRQNLLRVSDVIREVKRQLDALKRSAAKARRYRRMREELENIVLRLRFEEFSEITEKLRELEGDLESRSSKLEDKEASLSALEAKEESLRLELAAGEDRITDHFEQVSAIENEIARLEGDITVREGSIKSLEERITRLRVDEELLEKQVESERSEQVQMELELENIVHEFHICEDALREEQEKFDSIVLEYEGAGEQVETARTALFALGTEQSRLTTEFDSGKRATDSLERRSAEISLRIEDLEKKIGTSSETRIEKQKELVAATSERDGIVAEIEKWRQSLDESKREFKDLEGSISGLSENLAEFRGLERTLSALEKDREGFSEGVKGIMNDYAGSAAEGVLGVVADHIQVPQKYEKAVFALLGDRLQHIIVDKPENGLDAVGFLKEQSRGRGGFIPRMPCTNGNGRVKVENDQTLGYLTDLVEFSEEMSGVAECLLGDALLVEDLQEAHRIWETNGIAATMVTLDGDVVEPAGIITGGSIEEKGQELLARKRRLKEASKAAESLEVTMETSLARRDSLRLRISETEASLEDLQVRLREQERVCMERQGAIDLLSKEYEQLSRTSEDQAMERNLVEDEIRSLGERLKLSESRMKEIEEEEREAAQNLKDHESSMRQLGVVMENLRTNQEEARFKANTIALKKESSKKALESARDRSVEMDDRKRRISAEIEDAGIRIEHHGSEITQGQKSVETLAVELKSKRENLVKLREDQERSRQDAESVAGRVRMLRTEAATIRNEKVSVDIRIHELRTERQNLSARVLEEHEKDIDSLTREDFPEDPFDLMEAQERVGILRQKISSLGEVNPGAVEEFEELNERFEFLTTQQQDLEESIQSLGKAIKRINQESKDRFLVTFEKVSEKFSELFPLLFAGGTGEMSLIDETDPLNTGVEINVSLPGKRLKSMQLLSGGEKALVSLVMIFSMFLIKPSPFCILDEVDAPLDDENLIQFAGILRELSDKYQFLIVTHNKITMEDADVLYGITMREPGVSQVVSVRLREVA
ncbi:MAG: chromosome segregation protein SMC, partial [bacterium]